MRFGKRLMEELMEPGWEMYYIEYHNLKLIIVEAVDAGSDHERSLALDGFTRRLRVNIRAASDFAWGRLARILNEKDGVWDRLVSLGKVEDNNVDRVKMYEVLDEFVFWCEGVQRLLRFCQSNQVGTAKILKKMRKNIGDDNFGKNLFNVDELFVSIQGQLTFLIKESRQVEYSISVANTEHILGLRSSKAFFGTEMERLKLKRTCEFEQSILQPFFDGRTHLPQIVQHDFHPMQGLVGVAVFSCPFFAEIGGVPRSIATGHIFWTCHVACLVVIAMIQYTLVSPKLPSLMGKRVHQLSLLLSGVYLLLLDSPTVNSPRASIKWSSCVGHVVMETGLHCLYVLCTTRLLICKSMLALCCCAAPPCFVHVWYLLFLATYVPEFLKVSIDISIRKGIRKNSIHI
mmetsp:Transcript_13736/g.24412  ORF Transcript_13736/g.24412 Transcript_13736/m.24412 type:complete len:402 (+) Transcript_13736:1165-2370(+)